MRPLTRLESGSISGAIKDKSFFRGPKEKKTMKITFVHPPLSLESRYGDLSFAGGIEPPFGICYLASVARNSGFDVKIIDAQALNLSLKNVVEEIIKTKPDVVGVSSTTPAIHSSFAIIREIKVQIPDCVTLLGGCHISAIPDETMNECRDIDVGVIGEAESIISILLKDLENRETDLSKINGLIFRQNNRLIKTDSVVPISNLDEIPFPAFDLLPDLKTHYRVPTQSVDRYPSISLITSRGCIGKCTFCDLTITGRKPRAHSAEYTFELLRWVNKEFGIKSIMFEDDNFLMFRKRLKQLGEIMKKERLDITWSCTSRVDIVNLEVLKLAKSLGCWQILYGVETGSQEILDFYQKKITISKIENAIKLTKEAGLKSKGFIMLGNPLENIETMSQTLRLVLKIPINDISITFFTPYPGAPIYNDIEKYGQFEKNWEKMSCFDTVFVPNGLKKVDLKYYEKKILKRFYLRPKVMTNYIFRIKNKRILYDLMKSGLVLIKHILS